MVNKNNKISTLSIIIISMVIIVISVIIFCVIVAIRIKEYANIKNNEVEYAEQKNEIIGDDNIKYENTNIYNPVKFGEWGTVSKRGLKNVSESYKDMDYVDVPARIKEIIRGEEADKIVREESARRWFFEYTEPKEGEEWVVVKYQIDYTNIKFDKGKSVLTRYVNSNIRGLDGEGLTFQGKNYLAFTKDITNSDSLEKPEICDCQFAFTIPIECKKYLIKLGDDLKKDIFFKIQ